MPIIREYFNNILFSAVTLDLQTVLKATRKGDNSCGTCSAGDILALLVTFFNAETKSRQR